MINKESTLVTVPETKNRIRHITAPDEVIDRTSDAGVNDVILKSVKTVLNRRQHLHAQFFAVTKKLSKFFSISGSVLIVYSKRDDCLKAIALKGDGYAREGLAISLPRSMSLLYSIFENDEKYIENYPDGFPGNFVERKLILGENTKSVMIHPTYHKNKPNGLICFASPVPYAFVLFENGNFDKISEKIGRAINRSARKLNI